MQRPGRPACSTRTALLDTEPLQGQAWLEAARQFGTELSPAQLRELRGRRRLDCAERVRQLLVIPTTLDELLAVRQPIAALLVPQARADARGPRGGASRCREQGIPTALVTSSAQACCGALKVPTHGWRGTMDVRVTAMTPIFAGGKPAPDLVPDGSLARLGIAISDGWAFEVSVAGSQAATGGRLPGVRAGACGYPQGALPCRGFAGLALRCHTGRG